MGSTEDPKIWVQILFQNIQGAFWHKKIDIGSRVGLGSVRREAFLSHFIGTLSSLYRYLIKQNLNQRLPVSAMLCT